MHRKNKSYKISLLRHNYYYRSTSKRYIIALPHHDEFQNEQRGIYDTRIDCYCKRNMRN